MSIRVLSPEVASRIAAGEVVERPASAVKELIENSLDAGADEVRVEVREGGRRLLRVIDNGQGIPAADALLAFERHATSKLTEAGDLEHIRTLGFRGEALASIASVSQVTMLTRHAGEPVGTSVHIEGGRLVTQEPKGGPPGTIISVEHLFYNVPARLKFLRQAATEAGHIVETVQRFAMAFPERRFSLVSDNRLAFQSTGSGRLHDVLVKVWGLDNARQLVPVGGEEIDAEAIRHRRRPECASGAWLRGAAVAEPVEPQSYPAFSEPAADPGSHADLRRHRGVSQPADGGPLPFGRADDRYRPGLGGRQRAPGQVRGAFS